ncbi:MAG: PilZ domain-containing protein [Gemmatimonadales bacterium]|nr:PilZ domain-containing protein [Gemmatimonadales bacterium]
MANTPQERRQARRVDASLNLEVRLPRADGSETLTCLETINISSSGVYFKSDHFIEAMTKLAMDLEVLVPSESENEGSENALVPCEGLVVRTTPEVETEGCDSYEIAVFFTNIEPEGLEILERHISLLME